MHAVTLLVTFGVVLALELEEEGGGWPPSWCKCAIKYLIITTEHFLSHTLTIIYA